MAGTNNFLQFNPTAANQENDTAYAADSLRTGGAATGGLLPSVTANKLFFQLSTMVAGLAGAMAAKNYNMQDGNLANLITALGNIITLADVTINANYVKIGGIIIQWKTGTAVSGDSTQSITFPIAFPTACSTVLTSVFLNSGTNIAKSWGVLSFSTTSVSVQLLRRGDEGSFNVSPMIIAIGH